MRRFSHLLPGVPLALLSAVLFGLSSPLSKVLLGRFDPQLLAAMLYLGAGLGTAILLTLRRGLGLPAREAPLRQPDISWLAIIILFGGIGGPLLLMLGLARTSAASASLLLNLESVATMAIAWLVFRENVDRRLLAGAVAIVLGAATLSWQGHGLALDAGGVLVAGACLCWGIDNNLTRKLSAADPMEIAAIKGLAAGAVNGVVAILRGVPLPGATGFAEAALVGFFGIGVSLVLFILALRHLGSARTSAYFSLAPFAGALGALALLHEPATIRLLAAGLLMAAGLWLHLAERHDHSHAHEAMEHEHAHVHDEHHRHSHDGPVTEPHVHRHRHEPMVHTHPHYPDLHHRHDHESAQH